jgi:hypothetical protein
LSVQPATHNGKRSDVLTEIQGSTITPPKFVQLFQCSNKALTG